VVIIGMVVIGMLCIIGCKDSPLLCAIGMLLLICAAFMILDPAGCGTVIARAVSRVF